VRLTIATIRIVATASARAATDALPAIAAAISE
jgi:hypothetical protein